MKIHQKILFGYLAVSLLMVLVGAIAVTSGRDVQRDVRQAVSNSAREARYAAGMAFYLQRSQLDLMTLITSVAAGGSTDPGQSVPTVEHLEESLSRFEDFLGLSRQTTEQGLVMAQHEEEEDEEAEGEERELAWLETLDDLYADYRNLLDGLLATLDQNPLPAAMEAKLRMELDPLFHELLEHIRVYERDAEEEIEEEATEIRQSLEALEKRVLLATASLFLAALAVGLYLSRHITHPIAALTEAANRVSDQQLGTRVEIDTNDELKDLGAAFNDMVAALSVAYGELVKREEEAVLANRAKTRFLANISHEIRTPMNSIMGFAQLIQRQEDLSEKATGYLSNIHLSGQRLLETINNILDLTKIESGRVTLKEEDVELAAFAEETYRINLSQAEAKNIYYQLHLSPDHPRFIRCDREKIDQILINLLTNAIKYTPAGKSVDFLVGTQEDHLILEIVDTGTGIPQEKQESIFEPFEQVDNTLSRQHEGTGLGLALVKRLVDVLGGTVSLESTIGDGSHFTVRVPFQPSTMTSQAESEVTAAGHGFDADHVVLMVEDNLMNQTVSQAIFEELGLDLQLAINGREGLEKARALRPDLILMDIHMPGMDGIETSIRLRQMRECRNTPIVILSADAFDEQKQRAREIGIRDYLTKPLDLRALLPVLEKHLAR